MKESELIESIRTIDLEFTGLQLRLSDPKYRDMTSVIVSNFRTHLSNLGFYMAANLESTEQFSKYFSILANRPAKMLWAPESVLEGAKETKNSKIDLEKIANEYILLPPNHQTGGIRLYAKICEDFENRGGVFRIKSYNPLNYPTQVKLECIKHQEFDSYEFPTDLSALSLAGYIESSRELREKKIPFQEVLK